MGKLDISMQIYTCNVYREIYALFKNLSRYFVIGKIKQILKKTHPPLKKKPTTKEPKKTTKKTKKNKKLVQINESLCSLLCLGKFNTE